MDTWSTLVAKRFTQIRERSGMNQTKHLKINFVFQHLTIRLKNTIRLFSFRGNSNNMWQFLANFRLFLILYGIVGPYCTPSTPLQHFFLLQNEWTSKAFCGKNLLKKCLLTLWLTSFTHCSNPFHLIYWD